MVVLFQMLAMLWFRRFMNLGGLKGILIGLTRSEKEKKLLIKLVKLWLFAWGSTDFRFSSFFSVLCFFRRCFFYHVSTQFLVCCWSFSPFHLKKKKKNFQVQSCDVCVLNISSGLTYWIAKSKKIKTNYGFNARKLIIMIKINFKITFRVN